MKSAQLSFECLFFPVVLLGEYVRYESGSENPSQYVGTLTGPKRVKNGSTGLAFSHSSALLKTVRLLS